LIAEVDDLKSQLAETVRKTDSTIIAAAEKSRSEERKVQSLYV